MSDIETEIARKNPSYYKVLALYISFLLAVLFQFPLQPMVQVASLILLFMLVSCIGFIRREAEKDSYIYNHATFLSRTLWMWSFMLTLSIALAGIYISNEIRITLEDVQILSQDMMAGKMNSPLIVKLMPVGLIAMAPSTIYIFWRYTLGFINAVKGHFLKRPKSFL